MFLRLTVSCAILSILLLSLSNAEAARFGGGKSFGGSPSMSKSFSPPPQSPALTRQQTPGGAPGATGASPRFGGMGMLGGLLAGTLIGSLLFGGGFHGGGIMDILILGLILYLAFKLFARVRQTPAPADGPRLREEDAPAQRSGMEWGQFRSGPSSDAAFRQADLPANFDEEEFLRGAKMAYARLQTSWDKRDLDDIAQFTTPAVMKEIHAQAADDPNPSVTEVLLVNAQLLSVTKEEDIQNAAVYFDTLLREDPSVQSASQTREVWHFTRVADESWKLDGIRQAE